MDGSKQLIREHLLHLVPREKGDFENVRALANLGFPRIEPALPDRTAGRNAVGEWVLRSVFRSEARSLPANTLAIVENTQCLLIEVPYCAYFHTSKNLHDVMGLVVTSKVITMSLRLFYSGTGQIW